MLYIVQGCIKNQYHIVYWLILEIIFILVVSVNIMDVFKFCQYP